MLTWGYISDRFGRKSGMMSATVIIILGAILQTGAWGAGGSVTGMLQALIAYRFLIGIGIGAECEFNHCPRLEVPLDQQGRYPDSLQDFGADLEPRQILLAASHVPRALRIQSRLFPTVPAHLDGHHRSHSPVSAADYDRSLGDAAALTLTPLQYQNHSSASLFRPQLELGNRRGIRRPFSERLRPKPRADRSSSRNSQVVSAFVPLALLWICGENHLNTLSLCGESLSR